MRLKTLTTFIPVQSGRTVPIQPKQVDPFYRTPEYLVWRETVIARAGRRCEAIERGHRCAKAEPHSRMFADHIRERSDGGDPLDPANGQCLCGRHHTLKTTRERARRLGLQGG